MSKTSIVIIILCTAIIAAVAFFTLIEKPGIEDIYLINSDNIESVPLEDSGVKDFSSLNSDIYVIIPAHSVKSSDLLKIEWVFIGENGQEVVQKDSISMEEDGGGRIAVYFLKRDSSYEPGDYMVKADYNGLQQRQAFFTIAGTQLSNP